MKDRLKHCINALRTTEQMPSCELKDQQIDDVLAEIAKLGIEIDEQSSKGGGIRYREFGVTNTLQEFEVSVKIIQTVSDELIIIDADFGD